MKIKQTILALVPALVLVAGSANATQIIPLNTTGNPSFTVTGTSGGGTSILAQFQDVISGGNVQVDDKYTFTVGLNGFGSGSVSANFSGASNTITITGVNINGTMYSASAAGAGISNIPIFAGVPNYIEVFGVTGANSKLAQYSGSASFEATPAIPEPATWATFLVGFGFIGLAFRRKSAAQLKAA